MHKRSKKRRILFSKVSDSEFVATEQNKSSLSHDGLSLMEASHGRKIPIYFRGCAQQVNSVYCIQKC